MNSTQTQQGYQQFQQHQQQVSQQQGLNGLGAMSTQNIGQIDMTGYPINQNNNQQMYQNNNQGQGFSLGTIDNQEIRVGNGQFMSFLKSLFS